MSAIHLLAAYGLCFGLMQGKAEPLTNILKRMPLVGGFFGRLLICSYCTGFHCGWMVYCLETIGSGLNPTWYVEILYYTFASAAFCYVVDLCVDLAVRWLETDASQGS
jgi:hypothetical protein